jgi:zinc and cadmium transporter
MTLIWIIGTCFVGGLISLLFATMIFKNPSNSLITNLVSLAVGTLLTTAFLEIIPHAMELSDDFHETSFFVLIGILVLFVLEKLLIWRHCHGLDCESHSPEIDINKDKRGSIIVVGDVFHNFVDGVLIASAFLVNINLGLVAAFSIFAHCLPQQMTNFSILLNSGFSKFKAYLFNIVSSISQLVGAILSFYILSMMNHLIPVILSFAAASMIYVAVSDLIPGLHKKTETKDSIRQILMIVIGVVIIYIIHSYLH